MNPPPFHRLPPLPPEHVTPAPRMIGDRVLDLEIGQRDLRNGQETMIQTVTQMADTIRSAVEALQGPPGKPEEGALARLRDHDKRRRRMDAIVWTVITAMVLGGFTLLLRLSYVVQMNRLP